MNCPFHIMIYKTQRRSYRELPLRYAELGTVYRYERSGVLHGLLRVRGFTQDDAHLFCRPDQLRRRDRCACSTSSTGMILRTFGFDATTSTSRRGPRSTWAGRAVGDRDERALSEALEERGLPYKVDEGEGAFYGPKIDIKIKDSLGRAWQCTTIQFDFNIPSASTSSTSARTARRTGP